MKEAKEGRSKSGDCKLPQGVLDIGSSRQEGVDAPSGRQERKGRLKVFLSPFIPLSYQFHGNIPVQCHTCIMNAIMH